MQKLVWTNAKGDVTDLTGGSFGITRWEGFSDTGLNIQTQTVPFSDGAVYLDALLNQRELSVTLAIDDGNDLATRYALRRQLIAALNPKLGEGYLIYTNDHTSKRIKCVAHLPVFENKNANDPGTQKASLVWTACEPYWEDLEETSVTFNNIQEIVNGGDVPASARLLCDAGSENFYIKNFTTEQEISMRGSTQSAVQVDTSSGKKSVVSRQYSFTPTQRDGYLSRICFAKNRFVYVGQYGLYTYNPLEEKYYYYYSSVSYRNICYGAGVFVACNSVAPTLWSEDGITWNPIKNKSPNLYRFNLVIYDGTQFVGLSKEYVFRSTDGKTWTRDAVTGMGNITNFGQIAYSESLGLFVVSSSSIYYSTNLTEWTNVTMNFVTNGVCWSKELSLFVVAGNQGGVATSTDGINWTDRTSGLSGSIEQVRSLNWHLVAVGNGGLTVSDDGVTWNAVYIASGYSMGFNDCGFGLGKYLVVADDSVVYESSNLTEWTIINFQPSRNSIFFGGGKFISTGETPSYDYPLPGISENGIMWKLASTRYIKRIAYGNGVFVSGGNAQGYSYKICSSTDGINWTERTENRNVYAICFGGGQFVAIGNGSVYLSEDGISWTTETLSGLTSASAVIYEGGKYVAVSGNGVWTSTDGINWTQRSSGLGTGLISVAYGNGMFVAVGTSGSLITSSDGITWKRGSCGVSSNLLQVCYGDGEFLIVCSSFVLVSADAVGWTKIIPQNIYGNLTSAAYGKGMFVIGGASMCFSSTETEENYISLLTTESDMDFRLDVGANRLYFYNENENSKVVLTYRQKYIGV